VHERFSVDDDRFPVVHDHFLVARERFSFGIDRFLLDCSEIECNDRLRAPASDAEGSHLGWAERWGRSPRCAPLPAGPSYSWSYS
jgi:hypothetical protein